MKYTLAILLLLSGCTASKTTHQTKKVRFKRAQLLPGKMFGMNYTADQQKIYVTGLSYEPEGRKIALYVYNSLLESWLDLSLNRNIWPAHFGRAVYIDDPQRMVVIGGMIPGRAEPLLSAPLITYDLKGLRSGLLGGNPMPSILPGADTWKNDIYVWGGSTTPIFGEMRSPHLRVRAGKWLEFTPTMYKIDAQTGVAHPLPDMPEAKQSQGGIINGKLYTFGGYDGQSNANIHVYDLGTKQWKLLGAFEEPISEYAIVKYQHYFLLLGDRIRQRQMTVFDTRTHTWRTFEMSFGARYMGAAVLNNTLHVFGGFSSGEGRVNRHRTLDLNQFFLENYGPATTENTSLSLSPR